MTRSVVFVFVVGMFMSSGQAARAQPDKDQYYRIKASHSGLVLGVAGSKEDDANVVQEKTDSNEGQQWKFIKVGDYYNVRNRLSGKSMNVSSSSKENGGAVIQWDASDDNSENQQWSLEKKGKHYVLKARHSELVLSVNEASKEPAAKILQWKYEAAGQQHFELVSVKADDKAKGKKIAFKKHDGHVEEETSGLEGEASYLAIADNATFGKIFHTFAVMDGNYVDGKTLDSSIVLAVIKRGKVQWAYTVETVTADKDTIYVQYRTKSGKAVDDEKTRSSELVLSVKKGDYKLAVFIEDGKKAGTATIDSSARPSRPKPSPSDPNPSDPNTPEPPKTIPPDDLKAALATLQPALKERGFDTPPKALTNPNIVQAFPGSVVFVIPGPVKPDQPAAAASNTLVLVPKGGKPQFFDKTHHGTVWDMLKNFPPVRTDADARRYVRVHLLLVEARHNHLKWGPIGTIKVVPRTAGGRIADGEAPVTGGTPKRLPVAFDVHVSWDKNGKRLNDGDKRNFRFK